MDKSTQPQGNFKLNLNYRRNANPKAPPITGTISTPEAPEAMYSFSAFEHSDKDGVSYWIGPVDMTSSVRQALNTTAMRGTNFVAIRENGFKTFKENPDGSPNPAYAKLTAEEQKLEDAKPAYWGTWTRGENDPQLRLAAWERDAARYGPWASGNTQHPMTKEEAAAMKAAQASDLAGAAAKPAKRKAKAVESEGRA